MYIDPNLPPPKTFFGKCLRFIELRRVPITVVLITVVIGYDVFRLHQPHFILNLNDHATQLGLLLIASGLFLRNWAAGTLHKNDKLATTGPYALTRNPLYLGSFLMMFGFCTLIGDWDDFGVISLLIASLYIPAIRREQKRLFDIHQDAWLEYCNQTPMLLPRRLSVSLEDWSISKWRKNNEYRALWGTAIGLLAMGAWYEVVQFWGR
ncbi:MAG: isoprenylcysteine carboxylmethyltransferase family protein [Pirellulales bacterium]